MGVRSCCGEALLHALPAKPRSSDTSHQSNGPHLWVSVKSPHRLKMN